jgi:hypothetical protein
LCTTTTPVLCDLSIRAGCQTIGDLYCDGQIGAS